LYESSDPGRYRKAGRKGILHQVLVEVNRIAGAGCIWLNPKGSHFDSYSRILTMRSSSKRKGKKGTKGMSGSNSDGMLPQMFADGDMGSADGKPRRIFQKKDLIEAVRKLSPATSHSTPNLQKKLVKAGKKRSTGALDEGESATATTLRALETGVNMHARRYNELKMAADKKQRELEKLCDQLHGLELENKSLREMQGAKTESSARIKGLQKECEEIQEEMNVKIQYRDQLDHMHDRLQQNTMKFSSHIKKMEDAMVASKREYAEVKLLLRQLEQGKTEAVAELQDTLTKLSQERKVRGQELQARQREAENAKRMEQWRLDREKQKAELHAELRGDLSKEEEERLIQKLKAREGQSAKLKAASLDRTKKALTLEDAFAQIRQATGVTSLEEMVDKFLGQSSNKEALLEEKAQAEKDLRDVVKAKQDAQKKFADMKAQVAQSGIGGAELNRDIYDKLDEEILGAKAELKMNRAAADRLERVLVSVQQGTLGLKQRLDPFKDLLTYEEQEELPKTSVEALDTLLECEAKLLKMLEHLEVDDSAGAGAVPGSPTRSMASPSHGAGSPGKDSALEGQKKTLQPWTPYDNEDPDMHAYNVRVSTLRKKGADGISLPATARSGMSKADGSSSDENEEDEQSNADRFILKRKALRISSIGKGKRDHAARAARAEQEDDKKPSGGGQKRQDKKAQAEATARLMASSPNKAKSDYSTTFLTTRPDLR
jgi:hypothetical protein